MVGPIRVALTTVSLDANFGPARPLLMLASRLDRTRFTPHLISFADPPDSSPPDGLADVPFATLATPRVFDVRGLWRLTTLLKRWRIDVVHARLQRPGFYARVAALAGSRPAVVVNVSNMYSDHFRSQHGATLGRVFFAADRACAGLADVWVANSRAAAGDLRQALGLRDAAVDVVHNAVDVASFAAGAQARQSARARLGIPSDGFVVGCLSRMVPGKRLDLLVGAAAAAHRRHSRLHLLMIGDGTEQQALEGQARTLGVPAVFPGYRRDVAQVLPAYDVFAFPSASEGQANVVLEAMAAGLPVVVADIAGMDELIEHGRDGLRVPPTVDAFAAAIDRLAANPMQASAMGARARQRAAAEFSPERLTAAFSSVYERAVESRR